MASRATGEHRAVPPLIIATNEFASPPTSGGLGSRGVRFDAASPSSPTGQKLLKQLSRVGSDSLSRVLSRDLSRTSSSTFWGKVQGPVEDKYELGEVIGRGAFGVVRSAKEIATGAQLCCKTVAKSQLSPQMTAQLHHETEVMLHLRGHPSIVTIMGIFEDEEHLHITQERCQGGSLATSLAKSGHLSERAARRAMHSVLSALAHCHAMHVLYRDVKPDHFLLVNSSDKLSLKAIDFGISIFLKPGELCETPAGTPAYWAPEVFDMEYSHPSDLWSSGVLMHQLLSGKCPFAGRTEPELYRSVLAGLAPDWGQDGPLKKVSEPARDLLRRLLTRSPTERITAQEALAHPWFHTSLPSVLSLTFSRQGSMSQPDGLKRSESGSRSVMLERMRSYCRMGPLRRAVMHVVARDLLQSGNLAGMQAMFSDMDANCNGKLSSQELHQALGDQVEMAEVQRLLSELDTDGDGELSPLEFFAAAANRSLLEQQHLLADAFAVFDHDGDGKISLQDLCRLRGEDSSMAALLGALDGEAGAAGLDQELDFPSFVGMMLEEEDPASRHCSPPGQRSRSSWRGKSGVDGCHVM